MKQFEIQTMSAAKFKELYLAVGENVGDQKITTEVRLELEKKFLSNFIGIVKPYQMQYISLLFDVMDVKFEKYYIKELEHSTGLIGFIYDALHMSSIDFIHKYNELTGELSNLVVSIKNTISFDVYLKIRGLEE